MRGKSGDLARLVNLLLTIRSAKLAYRGKQSLKMGLSSISLFQALADKMRWHQARQGVLAENIANADTPGYHTQDIDFRAEFAQQMQGQECLGPQTVEPTGLPMKADGNNVSLDRETRLLAENALRFSVATSLARSQLHAIQSAIEDGKSA